MHRGTRSNPGTDAQRWVDASEETRHESENLASPRKEPRAQVPQGSAVSTIIAHAQGSSEADGVESAPDSSRERRTGKRKTSRSPGLRRGSLAMLVALPASLRLVIITQFAFNVGFYLVVPFIAAHLAKDLLLAEWIIGLLLGLRTFSQQGMFFLGGALADRFGIKSAILVGCAIRICGFLALTIADEVFGVMVGVILIGFAAALFSLPPEPPGTERKAAKRTRDPWSRTS